MVGPYFSNPRRPNSAFIHKRRDAANARKNRQYFFAKAITERAMNERKKNKLGNLQTRNVRAIMALAFHSIWSSSISATITASQSGYRFSRHHIAICATCITFEQLIWHGLRVRCANIRSVHTCTVHTVHRQRT